MTMQDALEFLRANPHPAHWKTSANQEDDMASKNYEDKTLELMERMTAAIEDIAVTLEKMQQGNPQQAQPKGSQPPRGQPAPDDYPPTSDDPTEKQPDE